MRRRIDWDGVVLTVVIIVALGYTAVMILHEALIALHIGTP